MFFDILKLCGNRRIGEEIIWLDIKFHAESAKVTRPSVFAGKISVGLVKKIHTQDRLSGEKFKLLSISKHSSLVKLGVVWSSVKTYQTDCPVKNINFRVDCSWIFNKVWPRVDVFTWTDRDHNAPIFSTKRAYRNVVPCIAKTSQKYRTGGAKHQNKYITWKFNLSPTQWCKYHFNWISFKTQTFHLKVVSIDFPRILHREPCLPGLLYRFIIGRF